MRLFLLFPFFVALQVAISASAWAKCLCYAMTGEHVDACWDDLERIENWFLR